MTIIQAILLGIVQGITEFLPVSSSGHLIIVRELFGVSVDSLSFDVAVHVATLLAILWVMRKEAVDVLKEFFSKKIFRSLGFKIIIATIPAAVVGFLLSDDTLLLLRTTQVVAFSLIFWGVLLFVADMFAQKQKKLLKNIAKTRWAQAIFIGLAQAIALVPGTSRSGITMTAGLFSGIDRERAARFSFLLSIPAIAGAGVLTFFDAWETGLDVEWSVLIVGCLAAFIAGLLTASFLLTFLKKHSFLGFALYRIILGVILFLIF